MQKIKTSEEAITRLTDFLILSLDELTTERSGAEYDEGAIAAFVECLEVLSTWTGFTRLKSEDIEKVYPVR